MERVEGIGGFFFRSSDPKGLARWYAEHLGVDSGLEGEMLWEQEAGPTVCATSTPCSSSFGTPEPL